MGRGLGKEHEKVACLPFNFLKRKMWMFSAQWVARPLTNKMQFTCNSYNNHQATCFFKLHLYNLYITNSAISTMQRKGKLGIASAPLRSHNYTAAST